jgi:cytochrome o ubiquinol oxidase subunit II
MNKIKFLIGVLAFLFLVSACYFVLTHESALVTHPEGIIARKQLEVITLLILLMLIVVGPAMIFFYLYAWRYRESSKAKYRPEKELSAFQELLLWIIPSLVIFPMIVVTWYVAHSLDPYKPISDEKPFVIQVVAIDWKWLFIYPEQEIATLNFIQFPARTQIRFDLAADTSPMNSFWIPQLSGQIYAMTGMVTQLHVMADKPGEYAGKAVEINGEGYADMTFGVKTSTKNDFEEWVAKVRESPHRLNENVYDELSKPFIDSSIVYYSSIEKDLFDKIVVKYMYRK